MKLRNKKTGDVGDLLGSCDSVPFIGIMVDYHDGNPVRYEYDSLAKLNEEWEDAPDEEWRDVLGFEELYQVSNLGNVRTVKRGEATAMAQEEQRNGYLSVHLRNKGIERRASVHRLVAEAFIPNPDGLRDVNHKNGIKTDNRLENLEWMSHSDNMKHQYQVLKTGRYGHLYKPAEPLIKDELARKAIRAWAEANSILGDEKVEVSTPTVDCAILTLTYGMTSIDIMINEETTLENHGRYTIDELCGEEAPEPKEPSFIDLDERTREKEEEW